MQIMVTKTIQIKLIDPKPATFFAGFFSPAEQYAHIAAAFADATARIGLCPLWIAFNMELRHTHIIVEKTI